MASIFFVIFRSVSRNTAAFLLLAVMIVTFPFASIADPAQLTITSANAKHTFQVEVMRTAEDRARGLMFRRHLDADSGMLFDFLEPLTARMWMKNTYIPLDMLFIREDGEITNIAKDTVPQSTAVLSSVGKVRFVLELNAGTTTRRGIEPGDKVGLQTLK